MQDISSLPGVVKITKTSTDIIKPLTVYFSAGRRLRLSPATSMALNLKPKDKAVVFNLEQDWFISKADDGDAFIVNSQSKGSMTIDSTLLVRKLSARIGVKDIILSRTNFMYQKNPVFKFVKRLE